MSYDILRRCFALTGRGETVDSIAGLQRMALG